MPGQVLLEPLVEPVLLLAVHVQVVAQRPGHQHVKVAVGQVDAAARQHQQARGYQQQGAQGFGQAGRHERILAGAGQVVDAGRRWRFRECALGRSGRFGCRMAAL
ncbi:hypothetical protein BCV60_00010 [Bacillus halotolerans]|nr:hypothetical protein BCV60_00010 [Bacillus halotolerans]